MVLGLAGDVHALTQCLQCRHVLLTCPVDMSLLEWADIRLRAQEASSSFFTREEGLRHEVSRLEDRVRALEDEKTELVASSSDHTRPLMRYAPIIQLMYQALQLFTHWPQHATADSCLMDIGRCLFG